MTAATRVAVFTDNDFEKVNGVTTALGAALAGAPDDVRLRVYTASRLGSDTPDYLALPSWGVGIPFYRDMLMYWPPYRAMLRRLRQDRVNVVHLTTPGPVGLAALAASRRLGLPLVGSFHTDLARYTAELSGSSRLATFMQRYMHWLYGHCDRVLVPSEDTRGLLEAAGTPPSRVAVWGRGVDTALFTPARRSAALRAEWRAPDDRPVLLYVGRISREKGVEDLPRLHDALVRRGVPHRLVVVGDGPMRAELRARCPEAVCPGTLSHERLSEAYASADLFVFPSRTDTAGNVVLEAQASALPALVSHRGGPREHVRPGSTGIVCGDYADEWTAAAAWLLTDAATRRRMGAAARSFAESRTWSQALLPLYDAYRRASGATPPASVSVRPRRVA